ncbi:MAG: DNA replication/repair protein RecF [Marinicaulis sp.]|nr:DNA replication/repair protein RecF [Marinicaulis sp.]
MRRLSLTNFRSYSHVDVALDGRPVAIAGANGAGKTNFIEAISLIGPGRGLRSARLHELPRDAGDGGWAVSARLHDGEDEISLGVGAHSAKPERRVCRIEESSASGPSAFADHLRCLWLTPAQDRLFMEGAGERRKFLDRMTLAHNGGHAKASNAYEKAMRQRQRLLDEGRSDDEWLSGLEAQMAEAGVAIASARCNMVTMLAGADISGEVFPAADIALDGDLETALGENDPADVEREHADNLRANRGIDAHAGRCLKGPHRSDLIVQHREKNQAARLCSTGEQKALLIGLVLANARALAEHPGGAPIILLLDEIAAHLDPERRAGLFAIIDDLGLQAFMTGTDEALFTAWGRRAQCFAAENNTLCETTFE